MENKTKMTGEEWHKALMDGIKNGMTKEEWEELQSKDPWKEAEQIFKETGRFVFVDPFDIISEIKANNKTLILTYDIPCRAVSVFEKSDEDMYETILNHTEAIAKNFIIKNGENEYVLNISSTENFGYFHSWNCMKNLLDRMLTIFSPIVNQFIIWAQTGVLDEKLNNA